MHNKERLNIFNYILKFSGTVLGRIETGLDNMTHNRMKSSLLWIVTIVLSFSYILFLNVLTPLISDDFAYLFIYGENTLVASVDDILQSQINHYYQWGGRSVVHFIAQILLLLPSYIADLFNSLVYMGYIFLIYMHIKGRGQGNISLFILINLAVWFFQPVIGDTILWITGAANYLWGTFLILLFLLPFRLYEDRQQSKLTEILFSALFFFFGILAGWTNENTAGAMILIALLFCYNYWLRKWNVPLWAIIGLIGAIMGFCLMIMAPGNFVRSGESSLSLYLLGYRIFNCTFTFFYYCGPLIIAFFTIWFIYKKYAKIKDNNTNIYLNLIYAIGAIAAVYAMLLSPTFPRRALFGVVTFLVIGIGILWYNMDFTQRTLGRFRVSVILVGFVGFIFTYYLAYKQIDTYGHIVSERNVLLKEAKENNIKYLEFERYDGGIYIHGEDPFSETQMSKYYGIDIKLVAPKD